MAVRLADDAAGPRHPIARVGQTVVLYHRSGHGRVGREPEAAIVDDGRLETVDGCNNNIERKKMRRCQNEGARVIQKRFSPSDTSSKKKKKKKKRRRTRATYVRSEAEVRSSGHRRRRSNLRAR